MFFRAIPLPRNAAIKRAQTSPLVRLSFRRLSGRVGAGWKHPCKNKSGLRREKPLGTVIKKKERKKNDTDPCRNFLIRISVRYYMKWRKTQSVFKVFTQESKEMSFSLIASLAKVFTSRSDEESALHTSPDYIRTHFPFPLFIFFSVVF